MVMLGGVGMIGLLAVAWVLLADRRRQEEDAAPVAVAPTSGTAAAEREPERARAVWELDAQLEEAPVGTVEYLPLENGEAVGTPPEGLSPAAGPKRVNPRKARMEEAKARRPSPNRRSVVDRG